MVHMNPINCKSIYFLGIGGISMSALALIMKKRGCNVAGYDAVRGSEVEMLEREGIPVCVAPEDIRLDGFDAVVYTAALHETHPAMIKAAASGLPMFSRASLLGAIAATYRHSVGVAGTHGKSTCSGILSRICEEDGDSTYIVGAVLRKYISGSGSALINADDPNAVKAASGTEKAIRTFSVGGHADFTAVHTVSGNGFPEFDILEGGKTAAHIKLAVPGTHNVYNAVAAYAAARLIGISPEKAANGLNAFHGVKRRFELCEGIDSQAAFYADYAHHPDELKATLAAARSVTRGKVIAVFQPHTYSRLKSFFDDFTEALKTADTVIITDVYAARETNDCGVSGKLLADSINGAMYIPSFDTVADTLLKTASAGDTVMILGAGDIIRLVDILRRK